MNSELFIFIFLAVVCNVVNKVLDRYVLRDTSVYAFTWLKQILGTILFLPLIFSNFSVPNSKTALIVILIAGVIWTLVSLLAHTSTKRTEVSIKEPLSQSKIIWILLIGLFLLNELVTTRKIIGTIIVFIGICVVLFHPERKLGKLNDSGVLLTLGLAIIVALVSILDKFALGYFNPELYGFLTYLIPAIILTFFFLRRIEEFKHLWFSHGKMAILTIFFSTANYYFTLKALSLAEITAVYPLLQLATVFAVIGGIIFMKEREHTWQKIIGTIIVVIGAIVVKT